MLRIKNNTVSDRRLRQGPAFEWGMDAARSRGSVGVDHRQAGEALRSHQLPPHENGSRPREVAFEMEFSDAGGIVS